MFLLKLVVFVLVILNNWIIPVVEAVGNPEQFQTFGFDLKNDKTLGKILQANSDNSTGGIIYLDNLDHAYLVFDLKPLFPVIEGIAQQYQTIVLDCFPIIHSFPPGPDDNIYFHLTQATAQLNHKNIGKSSPAVQIWLHPHLHIPHLELKDNDRLYLKKAKPLEIARFMAHKANDVYPSTVIGVQITSTPLLLPEYRKKIPKYRKRLTKEGLKFGLMVEDWNICEHLPEKLGNAEITQLFSNFDEFFFHQPQNLEEEDKTGKALDDAILEARLFDGVWKTCEETLRKYLPEGKKLKPIRGYFKAKYHEDEMLSKVKFKFDIVRF